MLVTSWQLGPGIDGPLPSSSATALPCLKGGQRIQNCFPAELGKSVVLGSACKSASGHHISIYHLSICIAAWGSSPGSQHLAKSHQAAAWQRCTGCSIQPTA